jgi:hypothetical protein
MEISVTGVTSVTSLVFQWLTVTLRRRCAIETSVTPYPVPATIVFGTFCAP